jgi:hypothetical protein
MSAPTTFICDFTEHPLVWVDSLNNEGSSQRPHMRRRTVGCFVVTVWKQLQNN